MKIWNLCLLLHVCLIAGTKILIYLIHICNSVVYLINISTLFSEYVSSRVKDVKAHRRLLAAILGYRKGKTK